MVGGFSILRQRGGSLWCAWPSPRWLAFTSWWAKELQTQTPESRFRVKKSLFTKASSNSGKPCWLTFPVIRNRSFQNSKRDVLDEAALTDRSRAYGKMADPTLARTLVEEISILNRVVRLGRPDLERDFETRLIPNSDEAVLDESGKGRRKPAATRSNGFRSP